MPTEETTFVTWMFLPSLLLLQDSCRSLETNFLSTHFISNRRHSFKQRTVSFFFILSFSFPLDTCTILILRGSSFPLDTIYLVSSLTVMHLTFLSTAPCSKTSWTSHEWRAPCVSFRQFAQWLFVRFSNFEITSSDRIMCHFRRRITVWHLASPEYRFRDGTVPRNFMTFS